MNRGSAGRGFAVAGLATALVSAVTATPGTSAAVAAGVTPTVRITSSLVKSAHHRATFAFVAKNATETECALAEGPASAPFVPCSSPKTYRHLTRGHYAFYVRAVGPGGTSAPAQHMFKIS